MDSLDEIWQQILDIIAKEITPTAFNTWFSDCKAVDMADCKLVLHTSSDFKRNIIENRFGEMIRKALYDLFSCDFELEVLAGDELLEYERDGQEPSPYPEMEGYTFDHFVVGPSNKFAHAAAIAVAENPGKTYNPLFIYGNSGLGKTHLMHAIAHFVLKNNTSAAIAYISSENFVNEYVAALRDGNIANFRKRYRNTDVLLIDDVQFFAGKERCQEEFFHTFNELFNSGRQIVLSWDKPINEVADIEQRLVSRFGWGVSVDIQAPDYETRLAILQKKAAALGRDTAIDPAVLDLLARKFTKNIRRMEGALTNLIGYASLVNSENAVTLEKARDLLADAFCEEEESQSVDIEKIQKKTAECFNIDPAEIVGKRRPANIAIARQIAMFISRKLTTHSLQEIGRRFGGRDHGTVMHAIKVVSDLIESDENMRRRVEYLMKTL